MTTPPVTGEIEARLKDVFAESAKRKHALYTPEMIGSLKKAVIIHKTLLQVAQGRKVADAQIHAEIEFEAWENNELSKLPSLDRASGESRVYNDDVTSLDTFRRWLEHRQLSPHAGTDSITWLNPMEALALFDKAYALDRASGDGVRAQTIEECALRVEHEAESIAHAAMSMRNKPCRDRRDEEDYERMARAFDGEKNVLKKAADAVRAISAVSIPRGEVE